MKVYPLMETELDALGSLSVHSMVGFAIASSCLSFSMSLIIDGLTSPSTTPVGQVVLEYGPWVFGVIALIAAIYGVAMWRKRGTNLRIIKEQSKPMSVGGGASRIDSVTISG